MQKQRPEIGIVPVGDISHILLDVIAAHITEYLHLEAIIMPAVNLPLQAWHQNRQQYNVGQILAYLAANKDGGVEKVLGVLAVDLFIPIFTHVFGGAKQGADCAIVSIYRLMDHPQEGTAPSPRLLERSTKVALHEIGHLLNLVHCDDTHCLMHFSGNIGELDQLPVFFCRYCRSFLKQPRS